MKRSWSIWLAFGLCLAVVLAGMSWASLTALRLDRAEAQARRQAEREENVRLALWRMDSAVAPLIAQENARPYFAYSSFYPAERAYTRMFAEIERGEVLVPSPLLAGAPPCIILHFQFDPAGLLTSPQVPAGNMRDLAEMKYVRHDDVIAAEQRLADFGRLVRRDDLAALLPRGPGHPAVRPPSGKPLLPGRTTEQQTRSETEWDRRVQSVDNTTSAGLESQKTEVAPGHPGTGYEAVMTPVWVGGALILARRISVNEQDYVQGCRLDWPALRDRLAAEAKDLLPGARLEPATDAEAGDRARRLAALPVRLIPGAIEVTADDSLSPVRLSLVIAWCSVLAAAAAVAVLLRGAVSLSERRGAFVSAVSHEMRTPLTTFRMYSEMLAEGMVPDGEKRRSYLNTLRTEADRLGHLVENVLAYARLDGATTRDRAEDVTVRDLLARMNDRLARRAEQAGTTLRAETDDARLSLRVRTDPSAVEQILFNLVDNSCKYAASGPERLIHIEAEADGKFVALRVRDHGPGIAGRAARQLFRPFSKSARDAANSAPGVGLGLALSRRLARGMGGDLRLDPAATSGAAAPAGACFVLTLPASEPSGRANHGEAGPRHTLPPNVVT